MPSVFTKIINGEIPSYKIYEDDKTIAFLDIHPETKGHTLVVPKKEVDKIYDLPDDDYQALMATVKKLSRHLEDKLGQRGVTILQTISLTPQDEFLSLPPKEKIRLLGSGRILRRVMGLKECQRNLGEVVFDKGIHGDAEILTEPQILVDAAVGLQRFDLAEIRLGDADSVGKRRLRTAQIGAKGRDHVHRKYLHVFKLRKQNTVQGIGLHGVRRYDK